MLQLNDSAAYFGAQKYLAQPHAEGGKILSFVGPCCGTQPSEWGFFEGRRWRRLLNLREKRHVKLLVRRMWCGDCLGSRLLTSTSGTRHSLQQPPPLEFRRSVSVVSYILIVFSVRTTQPVAGGYLTEIKKGRFAQVMSCIRKAKIHLGVNCILLVQAITFVFAFGLNWARADVRKTTTSGEKRFAPRQQ